MKLNADQAQQEAFLLYQAEKQRQQISATTTRYPDMTIEDAYAIQKAGIDIKIKEGRTLAGYKIGLTSRTMQRSMNISEPDSGILLDDMVFEEGSELVTADFLDPRIEVELAFVLHTPLTGQNVSIFDVLNATDYVIPSVELIAARSFRVHPETKYVRTVRDTISDNAANAGIIVGGRAVKPDAVDLRWVGAMLYKNGVLEETGLAAGVLNHPAKGIAWLAQRYAAQGIPLEAGKLILSGSFTPPIVAKAGDTFHVDFGNLGSFGFKFI
ncbi:MAG: 2-oxo-hepta-3-ene-1,7-dioic acid hydratase [Saprospiraceae bacterium]|nr:2-oxo-hepta-3-ene-1,7-dioic acid hydratase [Saprospiraceae bacterium]